MDGIDSSSAMLEKAIRQLRFLDQAQVLAWAQVNVFNIMIFLSFVGLAIYRAKSQMSAAEEAGASKRYLPAPDYPDVVSLKDFSWKKQEPERIRPFKPKYHLTMDYDASALQNLDPSDLILMDKNYADRLTYRKKIMKENGDIALSIHNETRIGPAIRELYTWVLGSYLPKRYPTMFKLHLTSFETGDEFMFENITTKEIFPAKANRRSDSLHLLQTLGRTVDEDFLLLLPEEDVEDPKYVLEAYVTICPSGFNPSEKIGHRLATIHAPVPGYAEKIEGSMDRYFKTIEVGKYVKRANWSITTHGELFVPGSGTNHAQEGEVVEEMEAIDVENTFVRVERQTLHRLPKSKALVFAFKTYLYPIKEIKEEGSGPELAEAIDGMRTGSVPQMHFYKRGAVWGEAVKKYLRS